MANSRSKLSLNQLMEQIKKYLLLNESQLEVDLTTELDELLDENELKAASIASKKDPKIKTPKKVRKFSKTG